MADMTVFPETLELVVEQHTPVLPGADHIEAMATQELILTQFAPTAISSFPGLSRGLSHNFSDEKSDDAVLVHSTASGYPVLNKLFTFDGRTFTPELRSVIEADKLTVMAFYEINKAKEFPWYNEQDATWYTVCFINKPKCRLDGRKDLWRIQLNLLQTEAN